MGEGGVRCPINPQRTLRENVRHAVALYRKKYGRNPTLCLVRPSVLEESRLTCACVVEIKPSWKVGNGELWAGLDEEQPRQ